MKVTYLQSGAFRKDVEQEVASYFERTSISRQGSRCLYVKTAVLSSWLVLSYVALVFGQVTSWGAVLLAISLGGAMAAIGFNVQHDGGHRAYSKRRSVNRLMGFSLDVLGGSSYFWSFKHNIAHHTYPNISGFDDDIYVGALARLSPHDRRYWFHRFQHLYIWWLYALLAIKWQLLDDFRFIVKPGIARTNVPRPPPIEHALFWLGKAIFFGLALGVPLLHHPLWKVVALFAVCGATLGFVLGSVFQLAHCVSEADYAAVTAINRDWATYQVESAANFARGNRVITWLVGGLNFQIEHHLFPQICHTHYPALSGIVERVCLRHNVRYASHPTISAALGSHYRWLRQLGRGEA
jgi:linoleoyl-CoA desaturase